MCKGNKKILRFIKKLINSLVLNPCGIYVGRDIIYYVIKIINHFNIDYSVPMQRDKDRAVV